MNRAIKLQEAWVAYTTSSQTKLVDLSFDVHSLTMGALCGIALRLFADLGLLRLLKVSDRAMLHFILDVEEGYFTNPYHSFHHAVDVCLVLHYSLTKLGLKKWVHQEDILALMIAGLCHDIGHPGVNNLFQINAKTALAEKFSGISVLENHSCKLTESLLARHGIFNQPGFCPSTPLSIIEESIYDDILSTDMAFHFSLLDELTALLEEWPTTERSEDSEPSFRRKLCRLLLHAADISNAVRPWQLCKKWSDLVVSEFFYQGDLERKHAMSISPNMDRQNANQSQIALDFDEYIVRPFFEILAQFVPSCTIFLDHLTLNRAHWTRLQKQLPVMVNNNLPQNPRHLIHSHHPHHHPHSFCPVVRRVSFSAGTVTIPESFREEQFQHEHHQLKVNNHMPTSPLSRSSSSSSSSSTAPSPSHHRIARGAHRWYRELFSDHQPSHDPKRELSPPDKLSSIPASCLLFRHLSNPENVVRRDDCRRAIS